MEASEAFPFHPYEVVAAEQNLHPYQHLPYLALAEQAKPEEVAEHTYSATKKMNRISKTRSRR